MPAVSKRQQRSAGMALAAHEGKIPMGKLRGSAKRMAENMTTDQLREYASTPTKGLPSRKKKYHVLHRKD